MDGAEDRDAVHGAPPLAGVVIEEAKDPVAERAVVEDLAQGFFTRAAGPDDQDVLRGAAGKSVESGSRTS